MFVKLYLKIYQVFETVDKEKPKMNFKMEFLEIYLGYQDSVFTELLLGVFSIDSGSKKEPTRMLQRGLEPRSFRL